jgi:hypothetical protein
MSHIADQLLLRHRVSLLMADDSLDGTHLHDQYQIQWQTLFRSISISINFMTKGLQTSDPNLFSVGKELANANKVLFKTYTGMSSV